MVFILFLDALRRESGRFAGRSRRDDSCSRETEHIGQVIFMPLTEEVKRKENSNYMFIAENDNYKYIRVLEHRIASDTNGSTCVELLKENECLSKLLFTEFT